MLKIAYSGFSKPSALKIAEESGDISLVRDSTTPVLVNWGRYKANSTLNPDISTVTNKRKMRELFKEHGVPMPQLLTKEEVEERLENDYRMEEKFIGRPDRHTKGRGFWRIWSYRTLALARNGTRKKKAATHFMQFIESDREYRVHVFKGKSIRISEKKFNEDGTYTTGKPGDIKLRRVREAAKAAVDAVGLDFGAVDILARGEHNEEVFVTEVNAAPGCGGSVPKLYADVFKRWQEGTW